MFLESDRFGLTPFISFISTQCLTVSVELHSFINTVDLVRHFHVVHFNSCRTGRQSTYDESHFPL